MLNILSFDMEEWFESHFIKDSSMLTAYRTADYAIKRIINALKEKNIKCTFFILGRIAEEKADIVKMIDREGHEIASHGYSHQPIAAQSPQEFEEDLLRSIRILKSITGKDILGYRAPGYSITKDTFWALDIIKDYGLKYDSSIYPVSIRAFTQGGISTYANGPFFIKNNLLEFPLPTMNLFGLNIPVASTAYFRIFPYPITKWAINRLNKRSIMATVNFHTWEFDENQPRVNFPFPYNIKHYYNLSKTMARFRKLIYDFEFISCQKELELISERNKCA